MLNWKHYYYYYMGGIDILRRKINIILTLSGAVVEKGVNAKKESKSIIR